MTFPADRRIATHFGLLDVTVQVKDGGRVYARLARPDEHPRLAAVLGAFGDDEDDAIARLAEGIERWGSDPPAEPRPPASGS